MSKSQVLHLHIPKTAGTSLRGAYLGAKCTVLSVDSGFVYDPQTHADVDLFTGHAGFRAVEASPALRGRVVTLLRDPFERLASYYYHLVQVHAAGQEDSDRTRLAAKYGLHEFLAIKDHPHLLTDMFNAATWQLIFDVDVHARMKFRREQPRLSDHDLVERAKTNLKSFLVVGFQSHTEAFAQALAQATGFTGRLGRDNVNPARPPVGAIDAETRRRMRDWIELDLAVYDWALANLANPSPIQKTA